LDKQVVGFGRLRPPFSPLKDKKRQIAGWGESANFVNNVINNACMERTNSKKFYFPPVIRLIPVLQENTFCGSPLPGGNEDIGYDDEW